MSLVEFEDFGALREIYFKEKPRGSSIPCPSSSCHPREGAREDTRCKPPAPTLPSLYLYRYSCLRANPFHSEVNPLPIHGSSRETVEFSGPAQGGPSRNQKPSLPEVNPLQRDCWLLRPCAERSQPKLSLPLWETCSRSKLGIKRDSS